MFDKINNLVLGSKDAVIATTVKPIVNLILNQRRPGSKILSLDIDSKNKNVKFTVQTPELEEPITMEYRGYKIVRQNGKYFAEVDEVIKSRPWENSYIDGKRYKIPPEIVKAVEVLL